MRRGRFTRRDFLKTAGTIAAISAFGGIPDLASGLECPAPPNLNSNDKWKHSFQCEIRKRMQNYNAKSWLHPPKELKPYLVLEGLKLEDINRNTKSGTLKLRVRNKGNWPSYSAFLMVFNAGVAGDNDTPTVYRYNELRLKHSERLTIYPYSRVEQSPIIVSNYNLSFYGPEPRGGMLPEQRVGSIIAMIFDPIYDPLGRRDDFTWQDMRTNRQFAGAGWYGIISRGIGVSEIAYSKPW